MVNIVSQIGEEPGSSYNSAESFVEILRGITEEKVASLEGALNSIIAGRTADDPEAMSALLLHIWSAFNPPVIGDKQIVYFYNTKFVEPVRFRDETLIWDSVM